MSKEIKNLNNGLNNIYATKDEVENTKLHYTETVSVAMVFDNLNNVEMSNNTDDFFNYSFAEFKGKIPAIADDEVYLVRVTYSDNTIVRACGGLGEPDESIPSGSTGWAFYTIHGMLNEPFVSVMIVGDAKASDDKTSYIFEENTNSAHFIFLKGYLPDSVPVKLEFIVIPLDEANTKFDIDEGEEALNNHFDSYFITIEKKLEINDEFFKTHKFVTQDMINGIGNADNLSTNDKTIVGAINEVFQSGASVKQTLVDTLSAKGIDCSTSDNFENLISKINNVGVSLNNMTVKSSASSAGLGLLSPTGTAYLAGNNKYAQSGITGNTLSFLTQIETNDIKKVSFGWGHILVVKNNGTVWGCGLNTSGQLGLGDTANRSVFTQIPSITNAVDVFCGNDHSFILDSNGKLWAAGDNYYPALGVDESVYTSNNVTSFANVPLDSSIKIKGLYPTSSKTIMLTESGELWGCGFTNGGQLPGFSGSLFAKLSYKDVPLDNIKEFYAGGGFSIAIKNDDSAIAFGYNNCGQLMETYTYNSSATSPGSTAFTGPRTIQDANFNNIKKVACGYDFTIVLKNDGTLWGAGNNTYGALGSTNKSYTHCTSLIQADISDVKDVYCTESNTYVIKNDGTLWSCGKNNYGQLGIGSVFTKGNNGTELDLGSYAFKQITKITIGI